MSREIEYFTSLGRRARVFPLLVDGLFDEVVPQALRGVESPSETRGHDSTNYSEPLAADATPRDGESGRRSRHRALLKILAGVLEISFDDLFQRDRRRRSRWLAAGATFSLVLIASLTWSLWTRTDTYQNQDGQSQRATVAEIGCFYRSTGALVSSPRELST